MDGKLYAEMLTNLNMYDKSGAFNNGAIFVFGHCEASLTVIDELLKRGFAVSGILDNSREKLGILYRGIAVVAPSAVIEPKNNNEETIVLLATRFYEQMNRQLRDMGFVGKVIKLVDYNTYSEYSLSDDTIDRKRARVERGLEALARVRSKGGADFLVFCPFNALGDVYLCMSYLPAFLKARGVAECVVCVPSKVCGDVCRLFGAAHVVEMEQDELDAAVQAAIYTEDDRSFVAHQDRPYVINLHKALHIRKFTLDEIYRFGIFGLGEDVKADTPKNWTEYGGLTSIPAGKAAILSPYAKSVTAISEAIWEDIVADLKYYGYKVYTNVVGDEKALSGTEPISPSISEMKSVVERAGLFIGLRSGLCDILSTAKCRKIAFFPDYYYGDTRWKAIDMYKLDGFENIVVGEDFKWQMN